MRRAAWTSVRSFWLWLLAGAVLLPFTQFQTVLPLTQLVAVTGIWYIVFLMAWLASTVNQAWHHGFAWTTIAWCARAYAPF